MELVLNQCFSNISESIRYSIFGTPLPKNLKTISNDEIKSVKLLIQNFDSEHCERIKECIDSLNTEREMLLKQNSCLLSTCVSNECAKQLFRVNPEALRQFLDKDINIERLYFKTILIQRELLLKTIDDLQNKNWKITKLLELQNQQIAKLNESNDTLFKENYDLLKYRYLYSGSKNNQNKSHHSKDQNKNLKVLICDHNNNKRAECRPQSILDPKYLRENDMSSDCDSRFCQHSEEKHYESVCDNVLEIENQENCEIASNKCEKVETIQNLSKESLSKEFEQHSKASTKSKVSLLIEAEKAKIIQTTKTLDTLIKSKQQRAMKK